ncbi:3-dehydroquinate synthase [Porphyrobacter sp. GA68]|uniref:3-dehydroquinate synthase n=1 Tax=Porphyrobacter sp. GA68 TaxID=2883480 RepID=UPI001D197BE3|nr:3-dehydroquinate synthase [Porphyrobacter sp. GA68]
MEIVRVDTAGSGYDVLIGSGLIADAMVQARDFIESYHAGGHSARRKVPVVADRNAYRHHGDRLAHSLASENYDIDWYLVEPGEAAKSWQGLEALVDWLLARGITRKDRVFALGGGVVGDLTGFACAILKRGCGFVQLPTTLLAQVDSSVGGKTAINTKAGKNLVGAFHQPSLVLADTTCLTTLPAREMRAGYAEVLKYGVLGDRDFFAWLEEHGSQVISGEEPWLTQAVARSVAAKAAIVAQDERETTGRRALLNLGHTFGHALEAATGFGERLLHGEAVGLGMVLAARFSVQRGDLPPSAASRIERAVEQAGLPVRLNNINLAASGRELTELMRHDKKMEGGTLPFVLLRDIGAAYLARDVPLDDVASFLDAELRDPPF